MGNCCDCVFFDPDKDTGGVAGLCRRNTPTGRMIGDVPYGYWPRVFAERDWCGKFVDVYTVHEVG